MKKKVIAFILFLVSVTFVSVYAKVVEDALGAVTYTDAQVNNIIQDVKAKIEENIEGSETTIVEYGPPHGTVKIYVKIQFPDGMDPGSITDANDITRDHFLEGFGF